MIQKKTSAADRQRYTLERSSTHLFQKLAGWVCVKERMSSLEKHRIPILLEKERGTTTYIVSTFILQENIFRAFTSEGEWTEESTEQLFSLAPSM
jgi:hypothetical protein